MHAAASVTPRVASVRAALAASAAAAASCSAARRLRAVARGDDRERRDPAFDGELLRVRLAGRRDDRVFRHRQPPRLQPFLQPRLRILAERRRVGVAQHVGVDTRRSPRAPPSKPPSRNTAPNTASSASARIDARVGAAALQLAFAQPDLAPEPEPPRDARQRVPVDECRARRATGRPRAAAGKRSYSVSAMTQLRTASPTNSSRSLCGAP